MIGFMADSFPRQSARTQRFTLGAPRSFGVSPDGALVASLRSQGDTDPVTCLWVLDVAAGTERLVADPAGLSSSPPRPAQPADTEHTPERPPPAAPISPRPRPAEPADTDDPRERSRRERVREQASGIVGFATDDAFEVAAFALDGRVYLARLTGTAPVQELNTATPAADPRPDPAGRLVAYASGGALRVVDLATGQDRAVAEPGPGEDEVSFGRPEFVAAEEMDRTRGY